VAVEAGIKRNWPGRKIGRARDCCRRIGHFFRAAVDKNIKNNDGREAAFFAIMLAIKKS